MTPLPTERGVVVIGALLRDLGEGPWGRGAPHGPSLPPRQSTNPSAPSRVASHAGRTAGLSAETANGATSTSNGTAEPERQGRTGTAPATTCANCGGTGWTDDEFFGGRLGVPCAACGGA